MAAINFSVHKKWLFASPVLVIARALRVRLSVGPRRRYWQARDAGDGRLLVALGDSLTQGIGSSRPGTSWLALFAEHSQLTRLDNRAVYGARVEDVLTSQLPLPNNAELITLCVGANDSGRTPPEQFRQSLRLVCQQLPAGSIVGDVPEFQWGPRIGAAAELSRIVREVVAEFEGLRLAEVERHTIGTKILTELAGDFFHPNDRGYRRIARAFIQAK